MRAVSKGPSRIVPHLLLAFGSGTGPFAMGDLVLTETEYNPVIARLDEEPRLFLMHFWANDDAVRLARGLRAALDRTNSARS